jgi:hypothetical protein
LSLSLHFPQIAWSPLHEIVSDKLHFWKLCSLWVPEILTEEYKMKWQAHIITNEEKIQTDHFNSQDHLHSVL